MWIAAVRPGRRSSELCAKSTIRVGGMRGVMLAVVLSIAAIAGAQGQDVGHAPTGTAVSDSSRGHGPMFWAIQPGAGRRIDAASAPVLQRRISLTLTEVPLGLAVQRIAARARVDVTFSTELIPTGARALIAADDVTVAAALTRVLAHTKTDVLLGEEGQLTLIPQADARIAVDSSGALTGTLIDADNDQPVPYGTVTLLGTDRVIFADASGGFRLLRLTPGTYVVRARQIGYAPRDTTVAVGETPVVTTLTLRLTRIPAILDLVMVQGQRGTGCVTTGIPDSATNPGLAGDHGAGRGERCSVPRALASVSVPLRARRAPRGSV